MACDTVQNHAWKVGSRENRRSAHFLQGTRDKNSQLVDRGTCSADDAWENLVQIIQETAGPNLQQGAPRPTRPLALERRRVLLELGKARRMTGSSGDQKSLVENGKTEITRVEKQMRRFSRWLL